MDTKIIKPKQPAYQYPLLIKRILEPVLRYEPNQLLCFHHNDEINYKNLYNRVCQLANLMKEMGVKPGDTVAFMDWDSLRYLEAFFAVPMIGAVLHTINPRLSPKQILYTMNHAEDRYLFIHSDFVPLYKSISSEVVDVRETVLISEKSPDDKFEFEFYGEYEKLMKQMPTDVNWSELSDYEKEDNTSGTQELACSAGSCELVDLTQ